MQTGSIVDKKNEIETVCDDHVFTSKFVDFCCGDIPLFYFYLAYTKNGPMQFSLV